MEQENRLKITVWLKPDVVQRMDGWLRADNCKSRGEFTEKALRFYMGYLAAEDTSVFLSLSLYTHLRAHETGRNLVCRLLLQQNKAESTINRSDGQKDNRVLDERPEVT